MLWGKIIAVCSNKMGNVRIIFEARSRNNCCGGKAISTTYSRLVFVALVIQHAKPKSIIMLSSVASLTLPYFSTSLLKMTWFSGKKVTEHNTVFIFSTTFVWNIYHYEKNSARYYHKCTLSLRVIFVEFQWYLNYLDRFLKRPQI